MDTKLELPERIPDNDVRYLNLLVATIDYSSPDSKGQVLRSGRGYNVSVEPSIQEFRQDLIDNLLFLHRHLHIKIKFSSSLAISSLVQFSINK